MIFDLSNYRPDFQIVPPLCSLEFCNKVLTCPMFGGESEHLPKEKKITKLVFYEYIQKIGQI